MIESEYRKLVLKPNRERSVVNFHPWIFSGAVVPFSDKIDDGTMVEVYDSKDKFLATGYFHNGSIMVRILSFQRRAIDGMFWDERIGDAFTLRKKIHLADSENTNAYRLVHGEGDYLPGLIIDIYASTAVIQTHTTGMEQRVNDITASLQRIFGSRLKSIMHRSADNRSQTDSVVDLLNSPDSGASEGFVLENNHSFKVNWEEGQKTGFFLDQRENRSLLATYAKGKKVLNTFCYSGGFSVYALKAGASHVDSVDSSKKAIEWTNANISLNFPQGAPHASHVEDCFEFLKKKGEGYDIIVLDPPAFAKHLSAIDRASIGYRNLNEIALQKINRGGLIFTFSCSQAIDRQLFRKIVFQAAARSGRNARILHQLSQGPDHPVNIYHPEGEYLKGLVLEVD